MFEILKKGKLPVKAPRLFNGICDNCKCEVRCSEDYDQFLPYSRSNPVFKTICPTPKCGATITLKEYVTRENEEMAVAIDQGCCCANKPRVRGH